MNRMRAFPDEEVPALEQANLAKLNALQEQLDDLRDRLTGHSNTDAMDAGTLGQLAWEIVRSRRRRAAVFRSNDLFGEPAWDILLGLYLADQAQQKLSVSNVCDVAGVAPTTGLRWIERLEKEGWVHRTPDPVDRRRFWILLTERALDVMRAYLEEVRLRPNHG